MDQQALSEIAEIERTHWWYCARRKILRAVVLAEVEAGAQRGHALDLGCGSGANVEVVSLCGTPVGLDRSALALGHARRRGGCTALVLSDAGAIPLADASVDWIFALDILEHLDDGPAVAEIRRVLSPAGRAVITVPAFPALWGSQDDVAHHRRRYTKSGFTGLLAGARLEIRRLTYINSALFLPILLTRFAVRSLGLPVASENTLHPGWANPLLERIFAMEAHIVPRLSLPFGVSLLCVAGPAGPPA